ncbi:MAG: helix-turn-helix transcriptional regulator [Clostridiales bacterium]|nr:helix-turn-helix transcriptional regulator [Clostridiales bacterium]
MIRAYDKLYLEKAGTTLAMMMDFAVNGLHKNIADFFDLFIVSGVAELFGNGDVSIVAGRSGIELVYEVCERIGLPYEKAEVGFMSDRSREYWAGWALAYYQWYTSMSFREIIRYVSINDIVKMYDPYHEMDIKQFVDHMDDMIRLSRSDTNLKILRLRSGLSQSKLAEASGVPVRTIQQYEQRRKNINKAQGEYLLMLASALSCDPTDLIEKIQ